MGLYISTSTGRCSPLLHLLSTGAAMAEYSEGSSDDEYETMTTGQLLAKLEEVDTSWHAY